MKNGKLELNDLKKGMRVIYVPFEAEGNLMHESCRFGVVSSLGRALVFVKYDNAETKMITGDELFTAQPTRPEYLVLESELKKEVYK